MSSEQTVDPAAVEQTKRQIRGLVDEIAALSKQELEPQEYYGHFLTKVVEALAGIGGVVWALGEGGRLQVIYQINLGRSALDQPGEHQARHARLLGEVIDNGEGKLVPPHSGGGDEDTSANPTEMLLVLAPVIADQKTEAVVEIFQRPTTQPATRRGYLRFLTEMTGLAGEWLKSRKLRLYNDRESQWAQVDEFARSVHDSLDVKLTAYAVANDVQRIVGCDRVSVAIKRGRHCRIEAVSGQDTFDARSNVVRLLGELATKIVATGESLWYSGDTVDYSPQIEDAIHEYVDHSHSKTVAVLPLEHTSIDERVSSDPDQVDTEKPPNIIGALIIEQIEDVQPEVLLRPRADMVWGHSARALTNALDHNNVFLMPLWKTIGRSKWLVQARTLPKTLTVAAALFVLTLAMFLLPWRFELKAEGEVQPVSQRNVYAETEGKVVEVLVHHGEQVTAGQELIRMSEPETEADLTRVTGQLATQLKILSAYNAQLNRGLLAPKDEIQLSGQISETRTQILHLEREQTLLQLKADQLVVRSPMDGQVVSGNLDQNLLGRPVTAGNLLLTVADPEQAWELMIWMPENRVGHIAKHLEKLREDDPNAQLTVRYYVATNPDLKLTGTVKEIVQRADLHEDYGHTVQMKVEIDKDQLTERWLGSKVTTKLHCGYRPLGYVLLHDVYEWIQKTWFSFL